MNMDHFLKRPEQKGVLTLLSNLSTIVSKQSEQEKIYTKNATVPSMK